MEKSVCNCLIKIYFYQPNLINISLTIYFSFRYPITVNLSRYANLKDILRYKTKNIIIVMIRLEKQSKRDLKDSKIFQKELQDLHREVQAMNRKYEDRQHPRDSSSQSDYVDRKAKKWWNRFDERHFSSLSPQHYSRLRDITTSDRILQQSPNDPSSLLPYAKDKICNDYDLFLQPALIHILLKSPRTHARCLTSYQLEEVIPSYAEHKPNTHAPPLTIIYSHRLPSKENATEPSQLREIKLSLAGYNEDQDVCRGVEDYKRTKDKIADRPELDQELYLWEKELSMVNKQNSLAWDKLARKMKSDSPPPDDQREITRIREYLMWTTVLKYFEQGHLDKTTDQLALLLESERLAKPVKSKDALATKKFFETDCKICFCSYNYDSNQVLYCDSCNTSFHLACYGLQEIPKQQIYYCDCCRQQKMQNGKKLICQLCNKTKFPIKEIQGHFYHVTCLMLFNLARIRNGALLLVPGLNHLQLMQLVVDSELTTNQCEFCSSPGNETGIRMRCEVQDCPRSAHPICAYINGCQFNVKRNHNNQHITTSYRCNGHPGPRDWVQQTYLRRYMCNFKKTSQFSEKIFREQFRVEVSKREEEHNNGVYTWHPDKIVAKTRFIKKRLTQQDTKPPNHPSTPQTESRKMLEKLIRKKY